MKEEASGPWSYNVKTADGSKQRRNRVQLKTYVPLPLELFWHVNGTETLMNSIFTTLFISCFVIFHCFFNPWTYTQIHPPTVVKGRWGVGWRGVDGTPSRSFWYVEVFWKDFAFSGKPLIFLTRWGIFYGWWRCWRPVTSPTMFVISAAILKIKDC